MARELRAANVTPGDTRDALGRERFLPTTLSTLRFVHLRASEPQYWLWNYSFHAARDGPGCCSPRWISTHYVPPHEMRELHWAAAVGCEGAE
jgi:hypothetical protein